MGERSHTEGMGQTQDRGRAECKHASTGNEVDAQ